MKKYFYEYCDGSRIEVDILDGFHYKEGSIENGLVIEDSEGNQYVRIPSGYTPDGIFVRGFWVSRYEISIDENNMPHSVPNRYPVVNINYHEAQKLANKVNGFLLTGMQYNRICMWLVESKAATFEHVFVNGTGMRSNKSPLEMEKTGSNLKSMVNNIDQFWGNNYIWTSEKSEVCGSFRVIRGGGIRYYGTEKNNNPVSCRLWADPEVGWNRTTLRIVKWDELDDDDE